MCKEVLLLACPCGLKDVVLVFWVQVPGAKLLTAVFIANSSVAKKKHISSLPLRLARIEQL